jgi:hypothetical protein
MISLKSIWILLPIIFLYACSHQPKDNDAIFRLMQAGFERNSKLTKATTQIIYRSLEDKINDPQASVRARIWYPKARRIEALSEETVEYIEQLKASLLNESISSEIVQSLSFQKGEELIKRMQVFRSEFFLLIRKYPGSLRANN